MNAKDRLLIFIEHLGIGQGAFEKECEISNGYINNNKGSFGSNIVNRIHVKYPELNLVWLTTGEGEMLKSDVISNVTLQELRDNSIINTVPLLPISAQAGTLNDFIVSIKNIEVERIISPIKSADYAITVTGDSMAPEFPNGSRILIKKINENSFIEWGKVYVLDTYNGIVIKILNEAADKPGHLLCTSINQDQKRYAPFTVPKSDVIGVYKVMLCMSLK